MTESDLTKKMARLLRSRGGWARKTHGGPQGAGWPDLIACYRGYFIGIEVKLPGKQQNVTDLQREVLVRINAAGGYGDVMFQVSQVEELLDRIDKIMGPRKK